MKRIAILLFAGMMILSTAVIASADSHLGDPVKVAVCHFDGHDAGVTFAGNLELTGDYVIQYGTNGPTAGYCEGTTANSPFYPGNEFEGYEGKMILVSVAALGGHDVQLEERVAAYPNGWKK